MTNPVLARIQEKVNVAAQTAVDMNEVDSSGGGGRLIPAGQYVGRIVEYVDLGSQPQEYQGQSKPPADEIRLGVCLFYTNPDKAGDPDPYVLRPREMAISRNERATAFKAFSALNYKRDPNIKHFAQFLGQPFLFQVEVKTAKESKRQYNVIAWDKTTPAVNPMTKQPYDVPEAPEDFYRVFLWDNPTKEDWDALHIEGTRDDGKSKNFIQEKILSAVNYQGSPLQLLLEGGQGVVAPQAAPADPEVPNVPLAQPPVSPTVAPAVPEQTVVPAQTQESTPASSGTGETTFRSEAAPVAPVAPAVPNLPNIPGQA